MVAAGEFEAGLKLGWVDERPGQSESHINSAKENEMIRKALFGVVGLALLAGLAIGTGANSYVCTTYDSVKQSVKNSVPIEFEIERARKMVKDIVPEIRSNMHRIAKEEVALNRLEEQIALSQQQLGKEQAAVLRLKNDLATGDAVFTYASHTYSAEQVRADLSRRFARYKTKDATLENMEKIYEARSKGLEQARNRLDAMLASKRRLELEVEQLESRLKAIEATQAASEYSFDDSQLGRVKELVSELKSRLDVEDRLLNAGPIVIDEIPLDDETPENLVDQVTQYFETPIEDETPLIAELDLGN